MNGELEDQDVVICKCNRLSTLGIFVVGFSNPINATFPYVLICLSVTMLAGMYLFIHRFTKQDPISGTCTCIVFAGLFVWLLNFDYQLRQELHHWTTL